MQKDMHLVVEGVVLGICDGPDGFLLFERRLESFADGEAEHDLVVVYAGHPDFFGGRASAVAGIVCVADVTLIGSSTDEAPALVEVRDDVFSEALLPVGDIVEGLYKRDEVGVEAEEHGFAWLLLIYIHKKNQLFFYLK